ncbi:MAG: hypothetical protein WCK43_04085 [bacterium]
MKYLLLAALGAMTLCATCEETSLYEVSPTIKKVDFIKNAGSLKVVVTATGPIECYKDREIERIFEKDMIKVILRLKKIPSKKECQPINFEYQEKVYEAPLEQVPSKIWVLGREGWNKLDFQK